MTPAAGDRTGAAGDPPSRVAAAGNWRGADLVEADWRVAIPAAAVAELGALTGTDEPAAIAPDAFPATAAFGGALRERLLGGAGFAVATRLPMENWPIGKRRAAVAVLANMVGPVVAQTRSGTTFYDVRDTGKPLGYGVRRSLTNLDQPFHSDGPWLPRTPHLVALFCLETSRSGGRSRCVSVRGVHADLERDEPALAARLFEPFPWDRQAEHEPGDPPVSRHPVLWREADGVCARVYTDYVRKACELVGEPLDPLGAAALGALEARLADAGRALEFDLARGEVLWINNRWCAHARTGFPGTAGRLSRRHLIRTWVRFDGGPDLEGRQAESAISGGSSARGASANHPCM